jgi:glycosyltransferase involved in cell wall biosynthesis
VSYLPAEGVKAADLWAALEATRDTFPAFGETLEAARGEDALTVFQAARLAGAARRNGVTHLHAHFATAATAVARLAARLAGLPYTFTAHAKDIFHETVRPDDLGRKLRGAAAVVTVSDFNRAHLRRTFGPAAARVCRVYNGLDLAHFPYRPPADRPPRVVAVGRLVEKKGFADLLDACAVLAGRGREFTCQVIGGGELEADLRSQAERLNLHGRVELLGPRPQSEVIAVVQGAAVLAAPCVVGADGNRDGLPTVLLEAMALGTPCVGTPVTGIPEVVRDGDTGVIVPEHDPPALADAIERLLADVALRVRLAERARRLIEAEFDVHRNAARIRALFAAAARRSEPALQEVG